MLLGVLHDGPKQPAERLLQEVVQVVLAVNGQAVLQRMDRVLRLLPALGALGALRFGTRAAS